MSATTFPEQFNQHSSYLRGFAMKLSRDKNLAEDLFQETALKVFRNQDKFVENTNFKGWLSTIMKNTFINHFRKSKRRNETQDTSDEGFLLNTIESSYHEGEANIFANDLREIIDELDEGYRKPFLMAYQGYQYDEIQKAMNNLPMGTIKSRIHHARKILKQRVIELYEGEVA
jgi:RNA polymerase sigma-70 factor, ECF subfamily